MFVYFHVQDFANQLVIVGNERKDGFESFKSILTLFLLVWAPRELVLAFNSKKLV